MLIQGVRRYIDFRLVDIDSVPITGQELSDFTTLFKRNGAAFVPESLLFQENGEGRYTLSYTPAASGHDYLELYHAASDIRVTDIEDIVGAGLLGADTEVIYLDQDYGGTDALRVLESDPQEYKLYVYPSAAWLMNQRATEDAAGVTGLDSEGRWLARIPVAPGSYHVVVKRYRTVKVIKPNLSVVS